MEGACMLLTDSKLTLELAQCSAAFRVLQCSSLCFKQYAANVQGHGQGPHL